MQKKNKNHVISFRVSDDEYLDMIAKTSDENGVQLMKISEFAKASLISSNVKIVDSELDRYRVFVLAQIGNLRNQLVKCLHQDRRAGIVSEDTYIKILMKIEEEQKEQKKLMKVLV